MTDLIRRVMVSLPSGRQWWLACLIAASTAVLAAPVAAQGQAQEPPPPPPAAIAGKWTVTMEMAMGTATVAFDFKQEAEKITGTYKGNYGEFPLEGVVKGRNLEFAVYMTFDGQPTTMYFAGEVAEDGQTMKGSATLSEMGEAGWLAKRAK